MGRGMMQVLEKAKGVMGLLGDSFISTEGILLALASTETQFTVPFLTSQSRTYDQILDAVQSVREKTGPANSRSAENLYDALNKYGIDFTEQAMEGSSTRLLGGTMRYGG